MKKMNLKAYTLVPALLMLFVFGGCGKAKKNTVLDFGSVTRGSMEKTVSSSGTLNPVAIVKVLARMNGKVEKVFTDFNAQVKEGEILAQLNTDMLRLQRDQQMTSVFKAKANYELQKINYENQEKLAEKNLISEYDLKTSKTSLDIQAADIAASEASLKVIETEINQYAYITSPINGIVLERGINVGDTVVEGSNSNSTSIFTLAENLKDMQIEAWVGELDVSSIHKGQPVRFTLESLSGRRFTGEVDSVRLIPSTQNSVVSYKVIINVENLDGSLLPGMTCAVDFIVEQRENILMVPNAALRYQPPGLSEAEISELTFNAGLKGMNEEQQAAARETRTTERAAQRAAQGSTQGQNSQPAQNAGIAGLVGGGAPAGARMMGGGQGGGGRGGNQQRGNQGAGPGQTRRSAFTIRYIWFINAEGKPEPLQVRAGISNGSFTEIQAADDIEGMRIILRERL
ncbi:MAG: efflux RND transporter periplasmic adaptor subunit [Treponema sp.]|jgi:HlyD family secretion protein|nr:efflux RND transporter periplasmic adaptor subunit [Treponema sp.]